MKTEDILINFKSEHPLLVVLNPEITISEILFSSSEDWMESETPAYDIQVRHPFVFDVRLIPTEFKGITVSNVWIGEFPEEFSSTEEELPLEIWYAPDRYERFVESNLELIAKKIQQPKLTKEEALDALTGGFETHIEWCKKLSGERRG